MVTSSFAPRRPPTTPGPSTASAALLLAGIASTSASGSLQIANNLSDVQSVTTSRANLGMFFNADSLWGNPTTASGTATYVTVGAGLAFSGGALVCTITSGGGGTITQIDTGTGLTGGPITASGTVSITTSGVTTGLIANAAVTYAKVQAVGASKLLGNPTTASATVSEISLGGGLAFTGSTLTCTVTGSSGGTAVTMQYPFRAGRLYSSPWHNDNNTALGANVIWLTPFVVEGVNDGVTFTTASIYVSSAAAAGKVARLMVFQDNGGTAEGGTLEVDIGTLLVDSTGVTSKTFSHGFATRRYWLAIWSDGNPSIRGTGGAVEVNSYQNGFLHTTGDFPVNGEKANSTFGSAPATCPTVSTTLNGDVIPLLYLSF